MKKRYYSFLLAACSMLLTGCGTGNPDVPSLEIPSSYDSSKPIELLVWGSEEDEILLNQIFESFQAAYQDQAVFQITFAAQGESGSQTFGDKTQILFQCKVSRNLRSSGSHRTPQ